MLTVEQAKNALDAVITKSRVHLYKPIQVAEILFRDRVKKDIDLSDLESYRTKSRQWRDKICIVLLGRVSTSSVKFQDDIFNAVSPQILSVLGEENRKTKGGVEAYIYNKFMDRRRQMANALSVCLSANRENFDIEKFINSFWSEPGLKRSLDKIYEIIVYALFITIVETLELKVKIEVPKDKTDILKEFEDFTKALMCLDSTNVNYTQDAKIYRLGVTNAADRGLDMYSNWGPAIQVKHLSLDEELAEEIVGGVSSDRIVIVCKNAEKSVITSLLTQIGWKNRIQSIITETDLIEWYEKALRGKYAEIMGDKLLARLSEEIGEEFPSVCVRTDPLADRHYEKARKAFAEM
ncbi:MAG: HaeII family restriction endonuclease [Planctomycetaceae bacterium]|nr:HaeII family restriction endonuclease [Planctomycetaceae bacterium]